MPTTPGQDPELGPLVKHFAYDGLGRLVRTLSPYPAPSATNNVLRAEHFYYDGIRRIQEVTGHPILSLEGLTESQVAELMLLAFHEYGVGDPPDSKNASLYLEAKQLMVLQSADTTYLSREYVWGPGDGRGGVDELLVQFDRYREPWWVLQDDGGDIVALCDLGSDPVGNPYPRVVAQWTYDAYGECLSAGTFEPHPAMHAGHKGLFLERLDEGVADANTLSNAETPRLGVGWTALYHVRNRSYMPRLGRWLQPDPNASGQAVLGDMSMLGQVGEPGLPAFSLESRFADGLNIHQYLASNGLRRSDPSGLNVLYDVTSGMVFGMYQSLLETYAANLSWDVEWAGDWNLSDDWSTREDNAWVEEALLQGALEGLGAMPDFGDDTDLVAPFLLLPVRGITNPVGPGTGPGAPLVWLKEYQNHHIATNKGPYSSKFKTIFQQCGMTLDDPDNIVKIPHGGRHARGYHEFVLKEVKEATNGLSGAAGEKALRARLKALRRFIRANPHVVYDTIGGKPTGWRGMRAFKNGSLPHFRSIPGIGRRRR